jgi:hypothetical protein
LVGDGAGAGQVLIGNAVLPRACPQRGAGRRLRRTTTRIRRGNCGRVGRCRRRRGFAAGCPCLTRRLLRIRPRPHSVSDSLPIFDAPRTFPESNVGHATIRLTEASVTTRRALGGKRDHRSVGGVHGGESDVTTVLRHCLGRRLGRRKSLRLNRRVGGRIMPGGRPSAFKSFICPNCQALYQIVKVEAGPETMIGSQRVALAGDRWRGGTASLCSSISS